MHGTKRLDFTDKLRCADVDPTHSPATPTALLLRYLLQFHICSICASPVNRGEKRKHLCGRHKTAVWTHKVLKPFDRGAVLSCCVCLAKDKLLKSLQSRGESYIKLIWFLWSVHRQQRLTYGADLSPLLCGVVGMKTCSADADKVSKRQFWVCGTALFCATALGKRAAKGLKEKAGEVRSGYGNLWNARSPRGGDPERLLLKDKLRPPLHFTSKLRHI